MLALHYFSSFEVLLQSEGLHQVQLFLFLLRNRDVALLNDCFLDDISDENALVVASDGYQLLVSRSESQISYLRTVAQIGVKLTPF